MLLEPPPGLVHLHAEIFHPGQHGVEAAEVGPRTGGDDPRQGGFAHTRGAVEDQVADAIGCDGTSQQPARAKDLLLTLKIIEAARPEPIRQGSKALAQLFTAMAEQVAHADWVGWMSIICGQTKETAANRLTCEPITDALCGVVF